MIISSVYARVLNTISQSLHLRADTIVVVYILVEYMATRKLYIPAKLGYTSQLLCFLFMLNKTVKAIGDLNLTGNVIPHTWFGHKLLRRDINQPVSVQNKCNLNALLILSDIVYWYRPTIIRDEATGFIQSIKPKFAGDKLQKTYKLWAIQFGLSTRQVKEACYFLKERGLITIECRNIKLSDGSILPNVTFFEPVIDVIRQISDITTARHIVSDPDIEEEDEGGHTLESVISHVEMDDVTHPNESYHTLERASTESSTEIGTDTIFAEEPQLALVKNIQIPIADLQTLNSKEDVLQALGKLVPYTVEADKLLSTLTTKDVANFKRDCKKHKTGCTCLHPYEVIPYKIMNEITNILASGAVDWGREGKHATKLIRSLITLKYSMEDIIYCMAWAYQTDQFSYYATSSTSVPKLMPKFLDLRRTGKLKDSLSLKPKESANDRNWKELQKNKEEIIKNASKASQQLNTKHGITVKPRL